MFRFVIELLIDFIRLIRFSFSLCKQDKTITVMIMRGPVDIDWSTTLLANSFLLACRSHCNNA